MYTPIHHREKDLSKITAFIKAHPFATLVTNGDPHPVVTHLPFIINAENEQLRIQSHLAKANPHWKKAIDKESLIIFQEPHAYISTEHYKEKNNVPTWNYIAVHVAGQVEIIENESELMQLMHESIRHFGGTMDMNDWKNLEGQKLKNLLKRVVGFNFRIQDIRGKFKLSQEESATDQQQVKAFLAKQKDPLKQELSKWMKDEPTPKSQK